MLNGEHKIYYYHIAMTKTNTKPIAPSEQFKILTLENMIVNTVVKWKSKHFKRSNRQIVEETN